MRGVFFAVAALALAGCLNWQAGYDNAAQSDCRDLIDADERRVCLDQVERNSGEHRAENRGG